MATKINRASNEAVARVKGIHISPRKLNLVAQLIRGKSAYEAMDNLAFCRKKAAKEVMNLLRSAIANAETNHGLNTDSLVVAEAWVGQQMILKRFMARARGRGNRILKPYSNMTIILREVEVA